MRRPRGRHHPSTPDSPVLDGATCLPSRWGPAPDRGPQFCRWPDASADSAPRHICTVLLCHQGFRLAYQSASQCQIHAGEAITGCRVEMVRGCCYGPETPLRSKSGEPGALPHRGLSSQRVKCGAAVSRHEEMAGAGRSCRSAAPLVSSWDLIGDSLSVIIRMAKMRNLNIWKQRVRSRMIPPDLGR